MSPLSAPRGEYKGACFLLSLSNKLSSAELVNYPVNIHVYTSHFKKHYSLQWDAHQ